MSKAAAAKDSNPNHHPTTVGPNPPPPNPSPQRAFNKLFPRMARSACRAFDVLSFNPYVMSSAGAARPSRPWPGRVWVWVRETVWAGQSVELAVQTSSKWVFGDLEIQEQVFLYMCPYQIYQGIR